jgi:hypothetical protein
MWHEWGKKRNVYRMLVGKPEGNRPLGRPRRRWIDNIRLDRGRMEWGFIDWFNLALDRTGGFHEILERLRDKRTSERRDQSAGCK